MAAQRLPKACIVQVRAHSTYPRLQMVSVTLSQSGTSIKKTLVQVLSGLGRNASTLMPSLYHFITHSCLPRFPSSSPQLVNIKSCIIYYLRAGKLMNMFKKKRRHPLSNLEPIIKIC